MRQLEAHEKLWPLVAECHRAQQALSYRKGQAHGDLTPFANAIKDARKAMKNYIYDNGLYFDQRVRDLAQELDGKLGNPDETDVQAEVTALESQLRKIVSEMT